MSTRGCIIELKKDVLWRKLRFQIDTLWNAWFDFYRRCSENGYRDGTERGSGGSILSRNQ